MMDIAGKRLLASPARVDRRRKMRGEWGSEIATGECVECGEYAVEGSNGVYNEEGLVHHWCLEAYNAEAASYKAADTATEILISDRAEMTRNATAEEKAQWDAEAWSATTATEADMDALIGFSFGLLIKDRSGE